VIAGAKLKRRISRHLVIVIGYGVGGVAVEDAQGRDRSQQAGSDGWKPHGGDLSTSV
jgi:hypothetical protein